MTLVFHITARQAWDDALSAGEYRGDTLASEGFIHCSLLEQVIAVAHSYYRGQKGLVLLCINTAALQAQVRYEDIYAAGTEYPHIYGPLNLDAVIRVIDFPPQADGSFVLPEEISQLPG